jgi:hypothetical protein
MGSLPLGLPLLILSLAASDLPSQSADSLSVATRAEMLSQVLSARYTRIGREPPTEACGIYQALGRDPDFRARFAPDLRVTIQGEVGPSCLTPPRRRYAQPGWYFERIEQPTPRKALLFAHVITPYGGHTEKYTLTNDPKRSGDRWPVEEVTLCDFSHN